MPSWSAPKPRLCPELHHIIIDFVATSTYSNRRDILRCALVNRNWNAYATRWLWRKIWLYMPDAKQHISDIKKNCAILSALINNPQLRKHIHHLELNMPQCFNESLVPVCYARRADFFALCQFLPPPVSIDLTHNFLTSEDGRLSTLDGATRMSRLLLPFFDSKVLTTLTFTGTTFPLGLLRATPNLIHLGLFRVEKCPYLSPEDAPLNLTFRLKSACFSDSFSTISRITSTNAQVFSELEVLSLAPAAPLNRPRPFFQLLSVANRTLKDLHMRRSGLELIEIVYSDEHMAIDWIFELRKLTIDFIFWEDRNDRWIEILDILDERHAQLRSLEKLDLKLAKVPLSELREIFEPKNRGWRLARKLLSPEFAPSLRKVIIRVTWCIPDDDNLHAHGAPEFDWEANDELRDGMRFAIWDAVELCMPPWEGDRRSIDTQFKVDFQYQDYSDDDSDYEN